MSEQAARIGERQSSKSKHSVKSDPINRRSRSARREEIREKLEPIFLQEGFRDLTIDSLAKRLSCSNRTLYSIAPSKEEMFLLVIGQCLDRALSAGLEGAAQHEDPVDRIVAYLRPRIVISGQCGLRCAADLQSYTPATNMVDNYRNQRLGFLEKIISSGIHEGSFRSVHPHIVAQIILSSLREFQRNFSEGCSEIPFDEATAELYDLVLHGLVLK